MHLDAILKSRRSTSKPHPLPVSKLILVEDENKEQLIRDMEDVGTTESYKASFNCVSIVREEVLDLLTTAIHYTHYIFIPYEPPTFASKILDSRSMQMPGVDRATAILSVIYSEVLARIKMMEESGCIQVADGNMLMGSMGPFKLSITTLDVSSHTPSIPHMYYHVLFCILVYFAIYLPYRIVITTGILIFLFYPLLIYAMFGLIIIRYYIGSPFRKIRRFSETNFQQWKRDSLGVLNSHFGRYAKLQKMLTYHGDV